jgi:hypothetical protein
MISYLAQQSSNMDISSEALHRARAAMSRMTPLGECVDECLKYCGESNILPVVKSIETGLRGAGLPTLLQSSWAVTSLSRGTAITVIKGKPATELTLSLLNVMSRQTGNSSAYKELCTAVASIAAFASSKLWTKKILTLIEEGYFVNGEDQSRYHAGLLLNALSKDNRSSEVLRSRIGDVIAVTFVGKHDSEKKVKAEFSEVFVGIGAPSAINLYNQEILAAICKGAESNNWSVRRQCYRALAVLAGSLTAGRESTLELLIKEGQANKHWKGKGSLLRALATLISTAIPHAKAGGLDEMILKSVKVFASEMTKKGPTRTVKYKTTAAKSLCSVVRESSQYLSDEKRAELWKGIWPSPLQTMLLHKGGDKALILLHETGFLALSYAFHSCLEENVLSTIVHGITKQSAYEVRVASVCAMDKMIQDKDPQSWSEGDFFLLKNLIFFCLADKFVAVRERTSALVLSAAFDKLPSFGVIASELAKINSHQETKNALSKLEKRK